jgi:hypothetical protein
MVVFRSFLQEGAALVPIEQATKTPPDDDYIDGAVEMLVDGRPILEREKLDLVDQLWAYLVDGLKQLLDGESFSTFYPDMPLEVRMLLQGSSVLITANDRVKINSATVELEELRRAMLPAAAVFFRRLGELSPANHGLCQRYLEQIEQLSESHDRPHS